MEIRARKYRSVVVSVVIRCLLPAVMLILHLPLQPAFAFGEEPALQPSLENREAADNIGSICPVSGTGAGGPVPAAETNRAEASSEERTLMQLPSAPTLQTGPGIGEGQPLTIVDVVHAEISRSIQGTAAWMDSFFGNRRYESELNQSYVRFRYNMFIEDGSQAVFKPDFQVRFVLPQLREKTHLVFSGAGREVQEFSALDSTSDRGEITPTEDRNVSAAVQQTFIDTTQQSFTMRAGLHLHNGKPALMLGPRYRVLFPLAAWNFRLVDEVLWRSNTGWESRITGDLERSLPYGLFFRATNEWVWTEHVDGYLYAFTFYVGQPLTHRRGLEYEWVNVFHTQPANELTEVTLRVRYRQQFWRDWLFLEISPQCRFPRDREFSATPGIVFRLDMIFGHYDGYVP